MAINLLALPQFQAPRSLLLDLAPINQALDYQQALKQQEFKNARAMAQDRRAAAAEDRDAQMAPLRQAQAQAAIDASRGRETREQAMFPLDIRAKQASIDKASNPTTEDITEFNFAKRNGYAGSFTDFLATKRKSPTYGMGGQMLRMPDGSVKLVQPGSAGDVKLTDLPAGAIPLVGGTYVTGDTLRQKSTGAPLENIAPNIAGKEAAEAVGQARGKAAADLPRIVDNASQALRTIQQIRAHPGREYGLGIGGVLGPVPGTSQAGFVDLVEQAKGKAFLEAFNSLKGGGQITEAEGRKATEAIARLNRARRAEDFDQALADFESVIMAGVARAQQSAEGRPAVPPGGAAQPTPQQQAAPKRYKFNPATGALE